MPDDADEAISARRFSLYAGIAIGLTLLLTAAYLFVRWATQFT